MWKNINDGHSRESFLGVPLNIGDPIIFNPPKYKGLARGRVMGVLKEGKVQVLYWFKSCALSDLNIIEIRGYNQVYKSIQYASDLVQDLTLGPLERFTRDTKWVREHLGSIY